MAPTDEKRRRATGWGRLAVGAGSDSDVVIAAELPSAILAWGGIGWLLDTYVFHTSPWVMVSGFFLGFALGMYLLYLRMQASASAEDDRRKRR